MTEVINPFFICFYKDKICLAIKKVHDIIVWGEMNV
jgi:hypothetical protein